MFLMHLFFLAVLKAEIMYMHLTGIIIMLPTKAGANITKIE